MSKKERKELENFIKEYDNFTKITLTNNKAEFFYSDNSTKIFNLK